MAITPQDNEAFLREVDDALRHDQLTGFWTRYGRWLLALIVLGLAAFGGWLWWNHQAEQKSGERGEELAKALDTVEAGDKGEAAKQIDALAAADQPGYRAAALLMKAALALEDGNDKAAIAQYKAIAADEKLAQPYRDLALVRQTALEFDGLQPQAVVDRLKPLAIEGNPWFGSAGEMVAIAYMKMRKPELAGPLFAAISKDDAVPETIRTRSVQMAGLLGVDAVKTDRNDNAGAPVGSGDNEGE
ncbi:MAG: tetratricopeptide repeat protein [Alphaproteobacteria bacterium]|nr:tetratricopeptide repeat protein [Alphaproteobacteria bacterium]